MERRVWEHRSLLQVILLWDVWRCTRFVNSKRFPAEAVERVPSSKLVDYVLEHPEDLNAAACLILRLSSQPVVERSTVIDLTNEDDDDEKTKHDKTKLKKTSKPGSNEEAACLLVARRPRTRMFLSHLNYLTTQRSLLLLNFAASLGQTVETQARDPNKHLGGLWCVGAYPVFGRDRPKTYEPTSVPHSFDLVFTLCPPSPQQCRDGHDVEKTHTEQRRKLGNLRRSLVMLTHPAVSQAADALNLRHDTGSVTPHLLGYVSDVVDHGVPRNVARHRRKVYYKPSMRHGACPCEQWVGPGELEAAVCPDGLLQLSEHLHMSVVVRVRTGFAVPSMYGLSGAPCTSVLSRIRPARAEGKVANTLTAVNCWAPAMVGLGKLAARSPMLVKPTLPFTLLNLGSVVTETREWDAINRSGGLHFTEMLLSPHSHFLALSRHAHDFAQRLRKKRANHWRVPPFAPPTRFPGSRNPVTLQRDMRKTGLSHRESKRLASSSKSSTSSTATTTTTTPSTARTTSTAAKTITSPISAVTATSTATPTTTTVPVSAMSVEQYNLYASVVTHFRDSLLRLARKQRVVLTGDTTKHTVLAHMQETKSQATCGCFRGDVWCDAARRHLMWLLGCMVTLFHSGKLDQKLTQLLNAWACFGSGGVMGQWLQLLHRYGGVTTLLNQSVFLQSDQRLAPQYSAVSVINDARARRAFVPSATSNLGVTYNTLLFDSRATPVDMLSPQELWAVCNSHAAFGNAALKEELTAARWLVDASNPRLQTSAKRRDLNDEQRMAVRAACGKECETDGFCLIQGPPGTGKTTTLLAILNTLHLAKRNKYFRALAFFDKSLRRRLREQRMSALVYMGQAFGLVQVHRIDGREAYRLPAPGSGSLRWLREVGPVVGLKQTAAGDELSDRLKAAQIMTYRLFLLYSSNPSLSFAEKVPGDDGTSWTFSRPPEHSPELLKKVRKLVRDRKAAVPLDQRSCGPFPQVRWGVAADGARERWELPPPIRALTEFTGTPDTNRDFGEEDPLWVKVDGAKAHAPRLLVCAPSNAALDEVVNRLRLNGFAAKDELYVPDVVRHGVPRAMHRDVQQSVSADSMLERYLRLSCKELETRQEELQREWKESLQQAERRRVAICREYRTNLYEVFRNTMVEAWTELYEFYKRSTGTDRRSRGGTEVSAPAARVGSKRSRPAARRRAEGPERHKRVVVDTPAAAAAAGGRGFGGHTHSRACCLGEGKRRVASNLAGETSSRCVCGADMRSSSTAVTDKPATDKPTDKPSGTHSDSDSDSDSPSVTTPSTRMRPANVVHSKRSDTEAIAQMNVLAHGMQSPTVTRQPAGVRSSQAREGGDGSGNGKGRGNGGGGAGTGAGAGGAGGGAGGVGGDTPDLFSPAKRTPSKHMSNQPSTKNHSSRTPSPSTSSRTLTPRQNSVRRDMMYFLGLRVVWTIWSVDPLNAASETLILDLSACLQRAEECRQRIRVVEKVLQFKRRLKGRNRELSKDVEWCRANFGKQTAEFRRLIVSRCEINFCTLSGAADLSANWGPNAFDAILVDEAAQCVEASVLVAMQLTAHRLILMGDPKQLSATVFIPRGSPHSAALHSVYELSLFERMQQAGFPVTVLRRQYRMHPRIRQFASQHFYHGLLLDGDNVAACPKGNDCPRIPGKIKCTVDGQDGGQKCGSLCSNALGDLGPCALRHCSAWPFLFVDTSFGYGRGGPLAFLGHKDRYERKHNAHAQLPSWCVSDQRAIAKRQGHSRENAGEAAFIAKYLVPHLMNRCAVAAGDIGVITFYNKQKLRLARLLKKTDVEVSSVDGFQGREKRVIVLSCVRQSRALTGQTGDDVKGGARSAVGFLGNERRVNVALTRAQESLIIVGHGETLATHPMWKALLQYARSISAVRTPDMLRYATGDHGAYGKHGGMEV